MSRHPFGAFGQGNAPFRYPPVGGSGNGTGSGSQPPVTQPRAVGLDSASFSGPLPSTSFDSSADASASSQSRAQPASGGAPMTGVQQQPQPPGPPPTRPSQASSAAGLSFSFASGSRPPQQQQQNQRIQAAAPPASAANTSALSATTSMLPPGQGGRSRNPSDPFVATPLPHPQSFPTASASLASASADAAGAARPQQAAGSGPMEGVEAAAPAGNTGLRERLLDGRGAAEGAAASARAGAQVPMPMASTQPTAEHGFNAVPSTPAGESIDGSRIVSQSPEAPARAGAPTARPATAQLRPPQQPSAPNGPAAQAASQSGQISDPSGSASQSGSGSGTTTTTSGSLSSSSSSMRWIAQPVTTPANGDVAGQVIVGGAAGANAGAAQASVRGVMRGATGLVYDSSMMLHQPIDAVDHPEKPGRISSIFKLMRDQGLVRRMVRVKAREVRKWEVLLVHSEDIWEGVERLAFLSRDVLREHAVVLDQDSLYANEHSALCARLSAGSLIEMCDAVAQRNIRNGFAVIRPPGHHAEPAKAMGFCLYNNVAIASKWLLGKYKDGPNRVRKILILDWDVHHGNGTQKAFEDDDSVLYISLHRHEFGEFYPPGPYGAMESVGAGAGKGYSINVPWPCGGMGDGDYLHAFQNIVMPIAYEFAPDMVIISAGFDAAVDDPLGGCFITPAGYAHMTQMLNALADGRLVVALEGGYHFDAIAHSAVAITRVILGDPPAELPGGTVCGPIAANTCRQVAKIASRYWKSIPKEMELADEEEDANLPKIGVEDLFRQWRSTNLWHSYSFADVPLPDLRVDAMLASGQPPSQTQVMCSKDLFGRAWKAVILYAHDMGNLRIGQNDLQLGNIAAGKEPTNSYLVDSSFAMYDWAKEKDLAVVDVAFMTTLPIAAHQEEDPDPKKQNKSIDVTLPGRVRIAAAAQKAQHNEEMLFVWDNFVDTCDADCIVIVGHGQACNTITNLIGHRHLRARTRTIVQVLGMGPIPLAPREEGDAKLWYYKHSKVICPNQHPYYLWGEQEKARRRLGRLERSSEQNPINMMMSEMPGILKHIEAKIAQDAEEEEDDDDENEGGKAAEKARAYSPPALVLEDSGLLGQPREDVQMQVAVQ